MYNIMDKNYIAIYDEQHEMFASFPTENHMLEVENGGVLKVVDKSPQGGGVTVARFRVWAYYMITRV